MTRSAGSRENPRPRRAAFTAMGGERGSRDTRGWATEARGFADGLASGAEFDHPESWVVDARGNVFVADSFNHRIRRVSPSGIVSTLAGGKSGFVDGIGRDASFNVPRDIALDSAGDLVVVDSENHAIRKMEIFP